MKLLNDFKTFLFRGNVVDLAVAVVIGTAFTAVVKALVSDLLTPDHRDDLRQLELRQPEVHDQRQPVRLRRLPEQPARRSCTVAAAMFFLVVTPINWLMSRRAQEDPETKQCPECDTSIPVKARRCPQCTTRLSGGPDAPARPGSVAAR